MPDTIHIGNCTTFISPVTISIVLARLAINNPMPENITAPNKIKTATAKMLP